MDSGSIRGGCTDFGAGWGGHWCFIDFWPRFPFYPNQGHRIRSRGCTGCGTAFKVNGLYLGTEPIDRRNTMSIKDRIAEKLPAWRERTNRLIKEHGTVKIADVTVDQIFGGIRGVPIEVSDISYVDPTEGLRLRGYTVPEVLKLLPKPRNCEYPLLGGLYFLLMTGELPTQEDAEEVEVEWKV